MFNGQGSLAYNIVFNQAFYFSTRGSSRSMGNIQHIISPGRWSNTWETSISRYWGNGSFLSGCEYKNPIYTATEIFKLVPDGTNAW